MQSLPLSAIFHRLELPPLSHAAGRKLLAKIFADAGLMEVDNAVLDKLHSLSAGSPLYAAELAKSICDRYVHREDHKELSGAACSVQLSSIIDGMRTDRIEEVVHFRFDKLTEQCQLVLKMAAVAAVNGSHFTLPMLKYILDSSDQNQSSKMQQV
jgi:predicted ATPase